jgi:cytochrome c553
MRPLLLIVVSMLVGWIVPALAAKGDPEAGRLKAEVCLACHGREGGSETPGIPSLAGKQDQFLQWQLVFFRSGRRANPQMSPMAAGLSDEDIHDLGAYFSLLSLPSPRLAGDNATRLGSEGQTLAETHHCSACHMDSYRGKQAAASLTHQRDDYLVNALFDYRSGARPSTGVAAMNEAASGLSDADIAALAHYLATLP